MEVRRDEEGNAHVETLNKYCQSKKKKRQRQREKRWNESSTYFLAFSFKNLLLSRVIYCFVGSESACSLLARKE